MSASQKQQLQAYLRDAREAVIWKTEGLSEYDVRRPLTRSGTNLLGLVKHLAVGEAWYLGQAFGRPFTPHLPWWDDDAPEGIDLWATATEGRQEILDLYRATIAHADETIRALDLDASGHVPWWSQPDVTLHGVLVHVIAETARHAGHADVLREQLDGRTGFHETNLNQAPHDDQWWSAHRSKIEAAARAASIDPAVPKAGTTVERAEERHWEQLRDVRLAALADSPSAFGSTLAVEQQYTEDDWRAWTREAATFLALESGQPIGIVAGIDGDDVHERKVVAMWVHPDHRRTGLSSALLETVEEWARNDRATRLTMWVTRTNEPASRLYRRHGFTATGVSKPLPSNPELVEDQLALALDLR